MHLGNSILGTCAISGVFLRHLVSWTDSSRMSLMENIFPLRVSFCIKLIILSKIKWAVNEHSGWGLFCFLCYNLWKFKYVIMGGPDIVLPIMCIFLSFFGIPNWKLHALLLIGVLSELMTEHSIPKTVTVYQDITAIIPTKTHHWSPDRAIDWIHDRLVLDWY